MFEFLFKYSRYVFEQGEFVLSSSWTSIITVLILAGLALPGLLRYRKVTGKSNRIDRVALGALRTLALAALIFCLFRPALVVSTAVPQENFVGILIDDSLSMQIADVEDRARFSFIGDLLDREEGELYEALGDRFKLRLFGFADGARRVDDLSQLTYTGDRTNLGRALDGARQELAPVPLAGLVLITDGADNSLSGVTDAVQALRAGSVPIFPIGLGAERFDRDIEISRVDLPQTVLAGSSVAADVVVEQKGFGGSTVLLLVEDGEGIISTQEVRLPSAGDSTVVKAHFTVEDGGPRAITFRIAVEDGEMVTQNNERQVLLNVLERVDKVLYFEGEPTYEVAFTRRVLARDDNIQLVVLLRMAENKFQRYDVDDPNELAELFPKTREELFSYKGIILGSIEPQFFTDDQLQMIVEFVSQRGGGLLMLGGRKAFSEGGWGTTPVADVLPVVLDPATESEESDFFAEVEIEPTLFGRNHAVAQLADTPEENDRRWRELPALSVVNRVTDTKPGASTLLVGSSDDLGDPAIVLAFQRFGSGKSISFTPFDVWLWQMHADIPLEDQTHETLWRQLLRWLIQDVPGQVELVMSVDRAAPGQAVAVTAHVRDDTFIEVNNADVLASVKAPNGESLDLPLDWTVENDGEYRATFTPHQPGFHEVSVSAWRGDEELGVDVAYIESAPLTDEYFGAERRTALLERIAEETGGRTYSPETVMSLPDDLRYSEGGTTVVEVKDLWDMPAIFLLLVVLVATEWSYRKWRGLA